MLESILKISKRNKRELATLTELAHSQQELIQNLADQLKDLQGKDQCILYEENKQVCFNNSFFNSQKRKKEKEKNKLTINTFRNLKTKHLLYSYMSTPLYMKRII